MQPRKIAVVLLIIAVAIGGFVSGLLLLQQRQDIREQAAVPHGDAKVSISPQSGNFNVGDTINTSISFNTSGIAVSGIAVRLMYPFTGGSPEVSVSGIRVNSALLSSGNWSCPVQNASQQGGNVIIEISCANISAAGFTSTTDTLLAQIDLRINRAPSAALEVKFDPALSVVTRKSDNQDILLIPTSSGKYTIAGAEETAAPTASPTPTIRTTATPTTRTTATPRPSATVTSGIGGGEDSITPTIATLPDSGVSYPTVLGATIGIMIFVSAILLAL